MAGLPSQAEKILIIHSGGIGDLLLSLPAMRMFRRAFPRSTLALLGRPERLSLIAFDLQAQSVHSIDRAEMAYFYAEGGALPVELSDFFSAFDVVLVFGRSSGSLLAENLKKAGAGRVILLLSFPPEVAKVHVTDYLADSLRVSGFEEEGSFHPLQLPDDPSDFAGSFLGNLGGEAGDPVLAIHPGSGSPAKNWSPENFAMVADRAGERAGVFLISGPAQDGVGEVRRAMKNARPLVAENLSLLQLAALLKRSTAYLGNDSGITHLAAALGLPTVAIFGPTDPARWGPRGPEVRILYEKKSCSPCSAEARSDCSCPCLGRIEPDRVLAILLPLLQ
jgi:ADP-heptose:LPS heptosyltransferase